MILFQHWVRRDEQAESVCRIRFLDTDSKKGLRFPHKKTFTGRWVDTIHDSEEGQGYDASVLWTGHPLTMYICAVEFVHMRGTHITRLAQGPARLK